MDIIAKALEQAERILKGVRASYIIVMPDGTTHTQGDLQLAAKPTSTRVYKFKRGELKDIYGQAADKLQPGEVWKIISPEGVTAEELRAAASAYAHKVYGGPNVMTAVNKEANTVEILRLA